MNDWISVEDRDRLPEHVGYYYVAGIDEDWQAHSWTHYYGVNGWSASRLLITHWMPRPEPPEVAP